jgi:hypothetical protein
VSTAGEDPILEAHRIVWDAERRVPIGERLSFAQLTAYREARGWWRRARGWWATADYSVKQLVFMLAAVVMSELLTRLIRQNGGSGNG